MKKLLVIILTCFVAFTMLVQCTKNNEYVDLGLPSGTLWKYLNESESDGSGFYTYDEAVKHFGNNLPTKTQWEELKDCCEWTWRENEKGYKVTGPNGKFIMLPAAGVRGCDGGVYSVGSGGDYWSSTPYDSGNAWSLDFYSGGVCMNRLSRCYGFSVRLVQD